MSTRRRAPRRANAPPVGLAHPVAMRVSQPLVNGRFRCAKCSTEVATPGEVACAKDISSLQCQTALKAPIGDVGLSDAVSNPRAILNSFTTAILWGVTVLAIVIAAVAIPLAVA